MAILTRRNPSPIRSQYQSYKPFLRVDFSYCCCYCSIHENEWGGPRHFHVEHYRPKGNPRFSHLETDYSNLLYSCDICNIHKGDDWPSDDPLKDGKGYLDPCQVDLATHIFLTPTLKYYLTGTEVGKYMIEHLHLNRRQLLLLREKRDIRQRTLLLLDKAIFMIEESLKDKSLPCHAVISLTAALDILKNQLQTEKQQVSATIIPIYQLGDFS